MIGKPVTVAELIEALKKLPQDAIVKACAVGRVRHDADSDSLGSLSAHVHEAWFASKWNIVWLEAEDRS